MRAVLSAPRVVAEVAEEPSRQHVYKRERQGEGWG